MYLFLNAMKNIYRHKRRYQISGIFLFIVLSVFVGTVYISLYLYEHADRAQNNYLSQITLKFREDLQWHGNENYTEGMPLVGAADGSTHRFNDDGTMSKYNIALHVKKDYFYRFKNDLIEKFSLAYYEEVYGFFSDNLTAKSFPGVLYGGELDKLTMYYCERYNIMFRFRLCDGVMYEKGECLIHYLAAKEHGYSKGDMIKYFDDTGKPLGSLKISGFFASEKYDYESNGYIEYTDNPERENSSFMLGSNPFFIQDCSFRNLIITDFDTAYYAYGNDESNEEFIQRHEFNKYIAWYTLNSPDNLKVFRETVNNIDDTHDFYPTEHLYHLNADNAVGFGENMAAAAIVLFILLVFIIFMLNIIITNERKYEIGILYSLGWSKKAVRQNFLYENLIFVSGFTLLSLLSGKIIMNIMISQNKYFRRLEIIYIPNLRFLIVIFGIVLSVTTLAVLAVTKLIIKRTPAEIWS